MLDPSLARREAALLRFMTIAEAYTDSASQMLFEGKMLEAPETAKQLLEHYLVSNYSTWEDRRSTFKAFHGISLGECPGWSTFRGYIEARNAIAHGLGTLTLRQLRGSAKALSRIRGSRIRVEAGRILLEDGNVVSCEQQCHRYVEWLDQQVRGATPSL